MTTKYGAEAGPPSPPLPSEALAMAQPGAAAPPSSVLTDPARAVGAAPVSHPAVPAATPGVDPLESAQGSIQMGTDGGFVAPQYTPTDGGFVAPPPPRSMALPFVGGAIVMAGLVFGALFGLASPEPEPTPPTEPAAPVVAAAEPAPALDEDLRALALVNTREPARALPFDRRHALLGRLEGGPDAERIDRTLNWALDLVQAAQSPMPCETFAQALDAMRAEPDPYYEQVLESARPPDPSCQALDEQRLALLDQLRPAEAAVEPEPPRGAKARGKTGRRKPKAKPKASGSTKKDDPPKTTTSSSSPIGGKLDDGLRPFGK